MSNKTASSTELKATLNRIIFGTDTPAGRRFDVLLIVAILISVLAVILESIQPIRANYGGWLRSVEWFFTLLFTIEYLVRLYCSPNPRAYATSFYGLVDLLAILPTYVSLIIPSASLLLIIRLLRVLRIFRVLKLLQYIGEANILWRSLTRSRHKIQIFIFSVMVLVTIFGSLMYIIEGPEHGFTSIPRSIYWAIVTITTVGYGDITPHTIMGQAISALVMLTGYAIIAVPTGIISAELINEMSMGRTSVQCSSCERGGHENDARFCRFCGAKLPPLEAPQNRDAS